MVIPRQPTCFDLQQPPSGFITSYCVSLKQNSYIQTAYCEWVRLPHSQLTWNMHLTLHIQNLSSLHLSTYTSLGIFFISEELKFQYILIMYVSVTCASFVYVIHSSGCAIY
jgi:hypothetical protein